MVRLADPNTSTDVAKQVLYDEEAAELFKVKHVELGHVGSNKLFKQVTHTCK